MNFSMTFKFIEMHLYICVYVYYIYFYHKYTLLVLKNDLFNFTADNSIKKLHMQCFNETLLLQHLR